MTHKTLQNLTLLSILALSLPLVTGCSNIKNSLGLEKEAPDEFAVITRAPLAMPPALVLPPPMPGMPRPQEQSAIDSAAKAVLGRTLPKQQTSSTAEAALLDKAVKQPVDPNIRAVINNETKTMHDRNKPVAEKLLNIGGNRNEASATVVDPIKELERIKKNKEEGKSILNGETPIIEE